MPEEQWSDPQQWVWQQICAGRVADLNAREGNELDPKLPDGWSEGRELRSDFLKEILFREPYRTAIPVEGVRIVGAWFPDPVDLASGWLDHQFWLAKCRFERTVYLTGLRVRGGISFVGSAFAAERCISLNLRAAEIDGSINISSATVAGTLLMDSLDVGQLFMSGPDAIFRDVSIGSGRVAGGLAMDGATITGTLNMSGLRVGRQLGMTGVTVAGLVSMNNLDVGESLYMRDHATFRDVDLTGAKAAGQLSMIRATVSGTLIMNGLEVGRSLLLSGPGATFRDINLATAKVGGQLSLIGATVSGTLNMNGVQVEHVLMQGPNATFQDVDLGNAKVDGVLSLIGATVTGTLNMHGLEVGRNLLMNGPGTTFREVNLTNAKIGGQLAVDGAAVARTLNMNGLEVKEGLFMRRGSFQEVDLTTAKVGGQTEMTSATVAGMLTMGGLEVGGQLTMNGARIAGELNMNGLEVRRGLFMRGPDAHFREVNLTGAKVAGELDLNGAIVTGMLMMNGLEASQSLLMWGATFKERINLTFSRVGRILDVSDAELGELDLSGARIEGELRLGTGDRPPPKWRQGARLILRNTHAGVVQDRSDGDTDAWPTELQLAGFTYGRLGSFAGANANMLSRDIDWYIRWLARDPSYAPQPYEQLAAVFREAGEPTKANRILYESRKRARTEAWRQGNYFRWLGSSFLKWTIGYGLGGRYFLALGWVVAFTVIGAGFLCFSGQPSDGIAPGLAARVVYSLDQLLPIVEFEKYDKVALQGWVAYYFYAQKLIGWVLGSFLVAGLAGLTQK